MALEIAKLGIVEYRQFRETFFDFTDPRTGKPLERVCLIGGNGTGKSTLLRVIWKIFEKNFRLPDTKSSGSRDRQLFAAIVQSGDSAWTEVFLPASSHRQTINALDEKALLEWLGNRNPFRMDTANLATSKDVKLEDVKCVFCPPDCEQNPANLGEVPSATLDRALKRLAKPESHQIVGQQTTGSFWLEMISAIKSREAGLLEYHKIESNRDRTIRDVEAEFLRCNPDVLKELADFWNSILGKASLEFDYENASIPIQLADNLRAFIRLRESKERVRYAELSTGIRNFIFKLGHIFTIFRGKPESRGILLVDEPENSLYPDFLFDLVGHYNRAAPGAQLFMATHSPIVAAQFKPEERFILEFDESGGVSVRRGVTPEGDDPNDVLVRDFAVRSLYGAKGLEKWQRFRELDHLIQHESDPVLRRALLKEYMDLGKAYNFSPDEVYR